MATPSIVLSNKVTAYDTFTFNCIEVKNVNVAIEIICRIGKYKAPTVIGVFNIIILVHD
jgi:hypothetical protein